DLPLPQLPVISRSPDQDRAVGHQDHADGIAGGDGDRMIRRDVRQPADLQGRVRVIRRPIPELADAIPAPGPDRAVRSESEVMTLSRGDGDDRIQVPDVPRSM